MEAATEKGEDGEVPTEGVQAETDRGGSETETETESERGGETTAETGKEKQTETKAESAGTRVKTGRKGGAREAQSGGGSAPVHPNRPIAQGLNEGAARSRRRRIRKTRGR